MYIADISKLNYYSIIYYYTLITFSMLEIWWRIINNFNYIMVRVLFVSLHPQRIHNVSGTYIIYNDKQT